MLALCHTLIKENQADEQFRHGIQSAMKILYLFGRDKRRKKKDASWASELTSICPSEIEKLALRMANKRTLVSLS